jgi:hypothetical protein
MTGSGHIGEKDVSLYVLFVILTEKAYNFSDAAVVAQFHALPETHENIPKLVEKWTNKTLSDIEKNEVN